MVRYLLILVIVVFVGLLVSFKESSKPNKVNTNITDNNVMALPIADFKSRITKKSFGTYVTPQNSPVNPEKFSGYHTGDDIEYTDTNADIPVYAIADGQIIYSTWAQGYGEVIAISHQINQQDVVAVYGHLKPNLMLKLNTRVKKGDKIAILGQGYSFETDYERKHLHLSIHKGKDLVILGYVQNKAQLSDWIDPVSLFY